MIGIISDTHGLLRPEVSRVFKGVELILHAGDIGSPEVLQQLKAIAPVTAVRGNNDTGKWAQRISERRVIRLGTLRICMLHDLKQLEPSGAAAKADVVVSGHSHRPVIEDKEGVVFINPGSAGPRRFKLPVTVGLLNISSGVPRTRLVDLLSLTG